MSSLKHISKYIVLTLIIASIIMPIITIYSQQQIIVAQIISITPEMVAPGQTVKVRVAVFFGGVTITVRLANSLQSPSIWGERSIHALSPGEYEVLVPLQEKLPGATDSDNDQLVDLVVQIWAVGQLQDHRLIDVRPRIVVTPPVTTIVDPYDAPNSVAINFLGFVPGSQISSVTFVDKAQPSLNYQYNLLSPVTIGGDASGSIKITLYTQAFPGLPKGEYDVICAATGTNVDNIMPGYLRIEPQVVILPTESHGRCETKVGGECETDDLIIKGYGFDANLDIIELVLENINFTNVKYKVPVTASVSNRGNFEAQTSEFKTNMTAGLYIPVVRLAPGQVSFTNESSIDLNEIGSVIITQTEIEQQLGIKASINATSYVKGFLGYILKVANESLVLTEVLKINIQIGNMKYQLAANRYNDGTVMFVLYNITGVPPVVLDSVGIPFNNQYYNETIGAYEADVSFNIAQDGMEPGKPPLPGQYKYWATFYTYPNKIVLVLREYGLKIDDANLTVVYKREAVTKRYYYKYPYNISVTGTIASISDIKLTDADIEWTIKWRYDASTSEAELIAIARPQTGPTYRFTNVYHIVRPLLVLVAPINIVIKPEDTVTIAAYGYAPGDGWGYGDNILTIYWEKAEKLGEFKLGRDGNLTFEIKIPKHATYGVHYIWGVDKWSYEYSLAIIIGAKAFWEKVVDDPRLIIDPTKPEVSAGLDDKRFVVCPCDASLNVVAIKFCGICVVYSARCDYLGDKIRVTLSGLYPGERIEVYFGGIKVKTAKADSSIESIEFIVPTLRSGTYEIYAIGSVSGYISISIFYNTTSFIDDVLPRVVPKILVLDLQRNYVPILVGPGLVRVIGTGFEPGVAIEAVLFNGTDAMVKFNEHVTKWYSDNKGVLKSPYTDVLGIYVPAMEPGAYEVKLVYILTAAQKDYSMPSYVFVINNISIVATKRDIDALRTVILGRLSAIESAIEAARGAISRVETALGRVENNLATIQSSLNKLADNVATKSDIQNLANTLGTVRDIIDRVEKGVNDLKNTVVTKADIQVLSDISKKLDTLAKDLGTALDKINGISTTIENIAKTIPIGAIEEIKKNTATAIESISQAREAISSLSKDVGALRTDVAGLRGDVNSVKMDVATVKSNTEQLADINSKVKNIEDSVGTVRTLVIIALVFGVIAAAAAIYAVISISRALAK